MGPWLRVAPSQMGLFGNASLDQSLRLTTFGLFGATAAEVPRDFVWAFPLDAEDRAASAVCTATGYRAAGHALQWADGRPYIREFAPEGGKE